METSNLKFIAFRKTTGYMALAAIGASALLWLMYFIPLQFVVLGFIIGLFALGFWMTYNVVLNNLQLNYKVDNKNTT